MGASCTRFLNLYLGTGTSLLGSFLLTLFLFGLWGVGWFALLEYLIPDPSIQDFQDGMSGISFILSAIYYRWLVSAFEGYNEGPNALRDLMLTIRNIHSVLLDLTITQREKVAEELKRCHILLDALLFFSFRLYIDHDTEKYTGKTFELVEKSESVFKSERKKVQAITSALTRELTSPGFLTDIQFQEIFDLFKPLQRRFNNADINITVQEPPFIDNHLIFVLFIYFFFVFPFNLYVQLGDVMVYSYPFLMTLFVGAYLIRRWQEDPLSITNPFGTTKYFEWRNDFRKTMKQDYKETRGEKEELLLTVDEALVSSSPRYIYHILPSSSGNITHF